MDFVSVDLRAVLCEFLWNICWIIWLRGVDFGLEFRNPWLQRTLVAPLEWL